MADPPRELRESYEQETVTQELLSQDWPDVYAVLATVHRAVTKNPTEARELLKTHAKFARALYQAQCMLGIAVHANEVLRPMPTQMQMPMQIPPELYRRLTTISREEFDRLPPEQQQDFSNLRRTLGLPGRP